MDQDAPNFPISAVANAVGLEVNTVRSWLQRGHFVLGKKDRKARTGLSHMLTFRTAMKIAITAQLYSLGMHPKQGSLHARAFTDFGDADRDPGELYAGDDFTVLLVFPDPCDAEVRRFDRKTPLVDQFMPQSHNRQVVMQAVWINFVDKALRVALAEFGAN